MYNLNQRQYLSWAEFLKDVALFCPEFDYNKSFPLKNYSFFKKDGQQILAGTFAAYVQALKDEVGLKIDSRGCFDMGYTTTILYEDYAQYLQEATAKSKQEGELKSLMALGKPDLIAMAEEKGIQVKQTMNKEQLVNLIKAA